MMMRRRRRGCGRSHVSPHLGGLHCWPPSGPEAGQAVYTAGRGCQPRAIHPASVGAVLSHKMGKLLERTRYIRLKKYLGFVFLF
jgi:hypothetical protein